MKSFYQLNPEEIFKQLGTSTLGLNDQQAADLRKKFGENRLQDFKRRSKWSILLAQFLDVMILILFVAAGVSFFVGEHVDALVILVIILGNAWLGYSQEYSAEESIRMLQQMSAPEATVIRNNNPKKIDAGELVPGDIILLEAGDIVPADGRLIEVNSLKTDEASLTGESHSTEKITTVLNDDNLVPGDQQNMVFKGTQVSNGSARAVITTTGMNTELGKIAGMMETIQQKTPLQQRLAVFSKQLAVIVILICLFVFGFGVWRGQPVFEMFLTALSLAVAALPEALPAVITIALAQGARRMVKRKALVRKLPAVETLGSVTYICSDKTGTLTRNIMTVENTEAADGLNDLLLAAMMLNNEVRFSGSDELLGDSTETALVKYAIEHGISHEAADKNYPIVGKLPFDSERMRMSTLHRQGNQWILFVKGAPIKMMEIFSARYKNDAPDLLEKNRSSAAAGLRVLFFGYRIFDTEPELKNDLEKDLDFLGLCAMIDPPREEVIAAISECRSAGIKTVMITGDQPLTAVAIAVRLGMIKEGSQSVHTGAELGKMEHDEFQRETENTLVYARVSPGQKLEIVKNLQANGEVVAMTGDGVNDAPSLKQADIGVAMGITGTDVSKDASDMILLDDNFATIVKAVREGRRIYDNIRKFILYVLSCNLAEILTIFLAPLIGLAIPLLPFHVLWINLVTDGLPGLALVAEEAEPDVMTRPPNLPEASLFADGLVIKILVSGLVMTAASLFTQYWTSQKGYGVPTQQTAVFTVLCLIQLANALSVRSTHSLFSAGFFSNKKLWAAIALTVGLQVAIIYTPFFDQVFKTTTLNREIVSLILIVTLACTLAFEVSRFIITRMSKTRIKKASGEAYSD
ncbi:MAG: cation-translocating P-type ATPase [Chitinophagaceae bacterium]